MRKKTRLLLAAALAWALVFGGCSLFDWLSGDEDETEEPAGIVYSFDPKAEGMEPWQVVISPDAAYFRLPDLERPGYRLYWRNLETGLYILPGKRLLFSSPLWTRNCRFEAEWERLIYIIAYHEGGGQSAPGNPFRYTVESEDIYLFPLTKAGWMFGGWYDNAACTGDPVTVIPKGSTGYKEFWAKWVEAVPGGFYRGGTLIDLSGQSGTTLIDKAIAWLTANAAANTAYTLSLDADIPAQAAKTLDDAAFHGASGVTLTLTTTDAATRSVTIDSAGGSLFRLEGNNPKTLALDGAVKLTGKENNTASLVYVNDNAALELKGSAQITGNLFPPGASRGGGVSVESGAAFTMSGSSVISGNRANDGGGVWFRGEFTMNGGEISNNIATTNGGGVCLFHGARFTMNGGSISGNTSNDTGGGLQVEGSNVVATINGGTISGNRALGADGEGGGGIMFYDGTLTINGGEIRGNTSAYYGGGISVCNDYGLGADLILNGGTVYGSGAGDASNAAEGAGNFGASFYVIVSGTAKYGDGTDIPLDEDGGKGTSATLTGRR